VAHDLAVGHDDHFVASVSERRHVGYDHKAQIRQTGEQRTAQVERCTQWDTRQ
jgi:hypothetical protein